MRMKAQMFSPGKIHFYFVNFEGLVPHAVVTPVPQSNIRIRTLAKAS